MFNGKCVDFQNEIEEETSAYECGGVTIFDEYRGLERIDSECYKNGIKKFNEFSEQFCAEMSSERVRKAKEEFDQCFPHHQLHNNTVSMLKLCHDNQPYAFDENSLYLIAKLPSENCIEYPGKNVMHFYMNAIFTITDDFLQQIDDFPFSASSNTIIIENVFWSNGGEICAIIINKRRQERHCSSILAKHNDDRALHYHFCDKPEHEDILVEFDFVDEEEDGGKPIKLIFKSERFLHENLLFPLNLSFGIAFAAGMPPMFIRGKEELSECLKHSQIFYVLYEILSEADFEFCGFDPLDSKSFFVRSNYKAPMWELKKCSTLEMDNTMMKNSWTLEIGEREAAVLDMCKISCCGKFFAIAYIENIAEVEPCNYYQINNIGNEDDEESIMAFNQMQMILHTTEDCSCCTTSNKYHQLQQEFISNTKIERHFIAVNNCEKKQLPLVFVMPKNIKFDGTNPCILYGYGSFNGFVLPKFHSFNFMHLKHFSGIFVIAYTRGDRVHGEKWRQAGRYENKQSSVDDFITAAEFLIENKFTNGKRILAWGRSGGALLATAATTQRPELFGGVVAIAGSYDIIRDPAPFEYGSPDEENIHYLLRISPYHNLANLLIAKKDDELPSILLIVGNDDITCKPGYTLKYICKICKLLKVNIGATDCEAAKMAENVAMLANFYENRNHCSIFEEENLVLQFINFVLYNQIKIP